MVPTCRHSRANRKVRGTRDRAEKEECYAITEEGAGSDVNAITAAARRDGNHYVLDGVKWHVTTFNHAQYTFFQAKLADGEHTGDHVMFVVTCPAMACEWCARPSTPTPLPTTIRSLPSSR